MSPDVHRQALLAAARVACAAALIGCAPKTSSTPGAATAPAELPAELATCDATLDAAFSGVEPPKNNASDRDWEDWYAAKAAQHEAARAQPEVVGCCGEVATSLGDDVEAIMSWSDRNDCCEVLDWQGSLACTPWGPPTPPAMPDAVA